MQINTKIINKAKSLIVDNNIPIIGMGTFGSDKYDADTVADAVYYAIECGYRMFDCASVYKNEKQIGEVFKKAIKNGIVKREELYITSKVWNDMHYDVNKSLKQTLSDLQLDYIDLYFVHWPFPNYHAPYCDVDSRNPDSRPFIAEEFMSVWRQMETLYKQGLVKNIAMSNMTIPKLEKVLPQCEIYPLAHEMELHPSFQQGELFSYCVERGIIPIAYCPLGSPNRPLRDKTPQDITDTEMIEIIEIAKKRSIHPAMVCLKWAVARGQIPIPFSANYKNIKSNLECVLNEPLNESELELIEKADKNCRLVKGHVFLWKGATDWTDLWDINNKIEDWKLVDNTWIKE